MTTLLQFEPQEWQRIGGLHTAEEITQQPRLWRTLAARLDAEQARIAGFLGNCLSDPGHRVLLTGAGSSAFIGEICADELNMAWPAQIRAVATTSLLTHPEAYLDPQAPTLLVSFARSGNSPESLGAVELLRRMLPAPRFLNITCNADGELARQSGGRDDSLTVLMPEGSCDRSFAMTSSFSCMLLAALTILSPGGAAGPARIAQLAQLADAALQDWAAPVAALAAQPDRRIVYLGSGPLEALAKESALKVLELSGGQALALANTALGFRHGPKSAVSRDTLVLVFFSNKPLAQRYEQDVLDELRRDQVASRCVSIGPSASGADLGAALPAAESPLSDAWLSVLWLLAAQMFSLHKSAVLGLTPDNPFPDGIVNRVVQGVTIYDNH
jgi:tagatose-6-phosphate ketose/aldose isomerase